MRDWKWWSELTPEELQAAELELEKYPHLKPLKKGWDGTNVNAYIRVPSQLWYLLNEDGTVPPDLQERLDSGAMLDTNDGGFMVLVPIRDEQTYNMRGYIYE